MMKLTKLIPIALVCAASFAMTSCDDGPMENAGETADEMADDAGDAIENAADEVEDAADDLKDNVDGK